MIDILLLVILGIVTWCVAGEGPFGAALTFLSVVFSGLLAMNFFEPLAQILQGYFPAHATKVDFVALVGLFALFVAGARYLSEQLAPSDVMIVSWAYHPLRWILGLATGYVTMAILLTSLHTSSLPREFMGFKPERKNFLQISAPDRQWLAFMQHVSENLFSRRQYILVPPDNHREMAVKMFDGVLYPIPEVNKSVYLPTFLIRYATRREKGGGMIAPAAPIQQQNGPGVPAGPAKPVF